jgi:hypothetical protein
VLERVQRQLDVCRMRELVPALHAHRGLGEGEGWVAVDLDLGGGEWWREEARWGG